MQEGTHVDLADETEGLKRASFQDICKRANLLHINVKTGSCSDITLLKALIDTPKVILEERAEPRTDIVEMLQVPLGAPAPGTMISELTKGEVDKVSQTVSGRTPEEEIERIGRRAFIGGISIFCAGALFAIGESARDPDGVVRWRNLYIPGLSSDLVSTLSSVDKE